MVKRKLQAFKRRGVTEPCFAVVRHLGRPAFFKIETFDTVSTFDGDMLAVKLTSQIDIADPKHDIAVLVGRAAVYRNEIIDPQSPELYYWNDKFWLQARNGANQLYYNNKCYLFYRVVVANCDKLLESLVT